MSKLEIVGKSLSRLDGLKKVTGQAIFADDLLPAGCLWAKLVRSPLSHALIRKINLDKASRVPGVKGMITGQDFPGVAYGLLIKDEFPLAREKVRYAGEPVAALAATSLHAAEEAASLVEVEYDPLPAVYDPIEAMELDAPLIHEGSKENGANVAYAIHLKQGNIKEAFSQSRLMSGQVLDNTFITQGQSHAGAEPRAAVASWDAAGRLTVYSGNKKPHALRRNLAQVLGCPEERVRVIQTCIGGDFGGRGELFPTEINASLLAKKTGRPVKLTHTRQEDFSTRMRHPATISLKTAIDRQGKILGRQVRWVLDTGAYAAHGPLVLLLGSALMASSYSVAHVDIDGYCVYTNKVPAAAVRGFGNPQGAFALESEMDMIAEAVGKDPLEVRLLNGLKVGQVTASGMKITSCGLEECIGQAKKAAAWKERLTRPSGRGQGAGHVFHISGQRAGPSDGSCAFVQVKDSGGVLLITSECDTGQGSDTILAQIVAQELDIPLTEVEVFTGDTDLCPAGVGALASRTTFIGGNAALAAARDAKGQMLSLAAQILEARQDDLEVAAGRVFVQGSPDRGVTYTELGRAHQMRNGGLPLMGKGGYEPPTEAMDLKSARGNISPAYSFGLQIVDLQVDEEAGNVQVLHLVSAHDLGRAINPRAAEGQVEGGAAMGLGYALYEKLAWEKGALTNANLADYKVPTALDMPLISPILVESIDPQGPFGAKGLGEPPTVPTAAAVANAIYQAVGVRIKELPITPEAVFKALKGKIKDSP